MNSIPVVGLVYFAVVACFFLATIVSNLIHKDKFKEIDYKKASKIFKKNSRPYSFFEIVKQNGKLVIVLFDENLEKQYQKELYTDSPTKIQVKNSVESLLRQFDAAREICRSNQRKENLIRVYKEANG